MHVIVPTSTEATLLPNKDFSDSSKVKTKFLLTESTACSIQGDKLNKIIKVGSKETTPDVLYHLWLSEPPVSSVCHFTCCIAA